MQKDCYEAIVFPDQRPWFPHQNRWCDWIFISPLLCAMVKPWYVCYGHLIIHPMVGILKMCVCIYICIAYIDPH